MVMGFFMSKIFHFLVAICGVLWYNILGGAVMKLAKGGTKNSPTYYVQKTVRIGDRVTTKPVERLGSLEELKARAGDQDPIEWAKDYVKKLTLKEKEDQHSVTIKYSSHIQIKKDVQRSCNIGYLFLQDIYYSLGLDKICSTLSDKYKFQYDLNSILSILIYSRIIYPNSKRSTLEKAKSFLEPPKCSLHQVYRSLEILAKENDYLQSQLYNNSTTVFNRNSSVLYYDCTNYYFEIEEEDDFRKYGYSKEHRPNPIVQMGLFMDANGIPLTFSLFNGNENEQPSLKPLEQKIIRDFDAASFVVCTDSGLSSTANRKFNSIQGRHFVTTQSIKKLKDFLQEFCLGDEGWKLPEDEHTCPTDKKKTFKLSEIDENKYHDKVFYKERWINEDGLEQHLIVTYSIKHRNYQRAIREKQIERAKNIADNPGSLNKNRANDPKRFVNVTHCTNDGEVAQNSVSSIDQTKISEEEKYDGFYAVCTNLECDIQQIIKINKKRWEIEECFRIMKSEFKARPVFLSRKDRITAHFIICFIALIIYRLLEHKLEEKYSCTEIIKTLKTMDMLMEEGYGYIPTYTRTDLTDCLHEKFGFRTDYQIITKNNMKKICSLTKK